MQTPMPAAIRVVDVDDGITLCKVKSTNVVPLARGVPIKQVGTQTTKAVYLTCKHCYPSWHKQTLTQQYVW